MLGSPRNRILWLDLALRSEAEYREMDLHSIRDNTEKEVLKVNNIPGSEERADILTKALRPKPFKEQVKLMEELPQVREGMLMKY